MPRASASVSRGGIRIPDTPSSTASAVPPTRVATTGAPAAIDSSSEFDSPSLNDVCTETATSASSSGMSGRKPVNRTRPAIPRRAASASSSAR